MRRFCEVLLLVNMFMLHPAGFAETAPPWEAQFATCVTRSGDSYVKCRRLFTEDFGRNPKVIPFLNEKIARGTVMEWVVAK
jgi:hypothetical protein